MTSATESLPYGAFSHATAPSAAVYRAVLGVFVSAKERFQVHLRPDDVQRELRGSAAALNDEALTAALDALVSWGNLAATPDTGRVTAIEDFYRRRLLFQLTPAGSAAERAFSTFDAALGVKGALQSVALSDIAIGLAEINVLVGAPEPDLGKVRQSLTALFVRFADLAENATAFMGSLQRTIDLTDTDEDAFAAYKTRLIEYLERFIHDLTVRGPQIAGLLRSADVDGVDQALRALAERDAAEAAPDAEDVDRTLESDREYRAWRNRWTGLGAWFIDTGTHPSQAKLLRMSALSAIPTLLDVVRLVNARRSGRSDRSTDYVRLAEWFQESETTDDRHRLWRSAFGLYSARHLSADAETWQLWSDTSSIDGTPWAQAQPLRVSAQLRRTASYERRGRPNQVIDRSADRAMLALRAEEEAAQIAVARRAVATRGTIELGDFARFDTTAFGLFLTLLGDALVGKRSGADGVSTHSSDGTMRIELTPIVGASIVAIHTERGTLYGPNHQVNIVDLDDSANSGVSA